MYNRGGAYPGAECPIAGPYIMYNTLSLDPKSLLFLFLLRCCSPVSLDWRAGSRRGSDQQLAGCRLSVASSRLKQPVGGHCAGGGPAAGWWAGGLAGALRWATILAHTLFMNIVVSLILIIINIRSFVHCHFRFMVDEWPVYPSSCFPVLASRSVVGFSGRLVPRVAEEVRVSDRE